MPRTAAQVQDIRRRSAAVILEAALAVFAERGFETATVAEVAERAGVSKGLIYNYFPSKDDLLVGVVQDRVQAILESSASAAGRGRAEPRDRAARLTEIALETTARVRDEAALYRLYFALLLQPGTSRILGRVEAAMRPALEASAARLVALFDTAARGRADSARGEAARGDAMLFQMALNGVAFSLLVRPELLDDEGALPLATLCARLAERFSGEPGASSTGAAR